MQLKNQRHVYLSFLQLPKTTVETGSWVEEILNLVFSAVREKCLHAPFCSSSFISQSLMHVKCVSSQRGEGGGEILR